MANATNTTGWKRATEKPAVSRDIERLKVTGDVTLSDDYAAGGDLLVFPEEYGTLRDLYCAPPIVDGYILVWNGDPDEPAITVNEIVSTYDPGDPEGTPAVDPSVTTAIAEVADETDNSSISVTVIATFES